MPARTSGPQAKADQVQANGALTKISGFQSDDGRMLDEIPIFVQSGLLNFFDGTTTTDWCAPCDLQIVGAFLQLTEVVGTGDSTLDIGISSDIDSLLDGYVVPTAATPIGQYDLIDNVLFVGKIIRKGELLRFTSGSGGTTTGKGYVVLTLVPTLL